MNKSVFNIGHAIHFITNELEKFYPTQEINAFIRIIFNHLLHINSIELKIKVNTKLSISQKEQISRMVFELKKYNPIQYVIGETEFYGLKFEVNKQVLIPRPETEELVDWIIKENTDGKISLLDMGTGSGCIAVTLSCYLPGSDVYAIDISKEALTTARKNSEHNKARISFILQDILTLTSLPDTPLFDLIVSNPPYVRMSEKKAMHKNILNYEPHQSLFVSDEEPLIFYHAIAKFALSALKPNGKIFVEINEGLEKECIHLFSNYQFRNVICRHDLNGKARMIKISR